MRLVGRVSELLGRDMTDDVVDDLAALTISARWLRDNTDAPDVREGAHELLKVLLDGAPDSLRLSMGVLE